MLVNTMTWEEICKELEADFSEAEHKAMIKLKATAEASIRKRQKKITETFHITTKRNNEWRAAISLSPGMVIANTYLTAYDDIGVVAYTAIKIDSGRIYLKFDTHFLKRYRLRLGLDFEKPEQIAGYFFKNNNMAPPFIADVPDEKGEYYVSLIFDHGMGLGYYRKDLSMIHLKTFISHDMFNEDQAKMREFMNNEERESKEITIGVDANHLKGKF